MQHYKSDPMIGTADMSRNAAQPKPIADPKRQIVEALMSPQRFAFATGKNFEGMYYAPEPERYAPPTRQMPANTGEGIAAMGDAVARRQQQTRGSFPKAPGNSPLTGFGRLMSAFKKPGLY